MISPSKATPISLLVLNSLIRQHLLDILERNHFKPVLLSNPAELAAELKERTCSRHFY